MAQPVTGRPLRIVLATRNDHKLREFGEMLAGIELIALPPEVELPPETGQTFAENALDKAEAAHRATGMVAIADDSGIEAMALDGRPGVYSARYAGPDCNDAANLAKLLEEVAAAGSDRRVAYVCALALVGPGSESRIFEGRCEGVLVEQPRGQGGFGYDPAFLPDATGEEDRRTVAELEPEEKHLISHRGAAARKLAAHLGL